ncbi:MAG: response regulator [Paenibacillus sp.]|jgi:YesN/AraC family two-component response regulator|nr:response regulator [Paenibacillus sp.]
MNIFLVEDEHWALAELAEQFKFYEPDHQIFAFENGDDALSAAGRIHPHLVLTDINMPGIDGLELIEKFHQLDPTIKSMILSVHDQFEYARQGMRFGVSEYLLKPVKKDVLFKAVDKAIQNIETDHKRREEWMNGSIAQMLLTADVPVYSELLAIHKQTYCMALLVMENGRAITSWKDAGLCLNDLKMYFDLQPAPELEFRCVDLDCRLRVLLIELNEDRNASDMQIQLSRFFQQLKRLSVPVHLGFAVKSEKNSLYEVFTALKQNMDDSILFGIPTFLPPGFKKQDADIGNVWDKVRVMETYFKKAEIMKGQAVLHQILGELKQRQITKRQLKLFLQDMLFSLKYNLNAAKTGVVSVNDLQENIEVLHRFSDYAQLFEWLNDKMISLYCGQEPKDVNPKGLIPVLLQLIHNNYQGNISLQQFAADHHVSLGYLSRMFKSQTGYTFSDYITGYRIKKAKELLKGGVERLQEVSRLVGYEDTKHFSALFKKIVGEAPISYAKRHADKLHKKEK